MEQAIKRLGLLLFLASWGCGGGPTPPAPTAPTAPTPPGSVIVTGSIVGNPQQSPVPGASVNVGTLFSTTASDGTFSLTLPPGSSANAPIHVSAPGHISRDSTLRTDTSRAGLTIDMITDTPPFSLSFYREFARNAADAPSNLQPLNPWTKAPSFYIKTTDDQGNLVPKETIDGLMRIFVNSVPPLTAGRFAVAAIETGETDRSPADGWVRVLFQQVLSNPSAAGDSSVGGNQGVMHIRTTPVPPSTGFSCTSGAAGVAVHEVVHAMGFWHTANPPTATSFGVITGQTFNCEGVRLPSMTQHHVAIAYSRSPGNRDPDSDASTFSLGLTNQAVSPRITISCPSTLW